MFYGIVSGDDLKEAVLIHAACAIAYFSPLVLNKSKNRQRVEERG